MKIAVIGSMCTGKTTLANDIVKANGMTLLPEVARQMIKEGYDLSKNVTAETEREILRRQAHIEKNTPSFVADRCVIDPLAYTMALFRGDFKLIDEMYEKIEEASYDIIFYLRPEFVLKGDGVRTVDLKFQKYIDDQFQIIVPKLPFKVYELKGSKEKRLKEALEIINKKI